MYKRTARLKGNEYQTNIGTSDRTFMKHIKWMINVKQSIIVVTRNLNFNFWTDITRSKKGW